MKLKTSRAVALRAALVALDGYARVMRTGDSESASQVPYKLTGETRKNIWRNITRLAEVCDAHDRAVGDKFREISGGRDLMNPEKVAGDDRLMAAFNVELNRMNDAEEDFELLPITEDAILCQDTNPVPGSVMAALSPILIESTD